MGGVKIGTEKLRIIGYAYDLVILTEDVDRMK